MKTKRQNQVLLEKETSTNAFKSCFHCVRNDPQLQNHNPKVIFYLLFSTRHFCETLSCCPKYLSCNEWTDRRDLNGIWSIQRTKPSTHTWRGQLNFLVDFYQINSLQLSLGKICNIYTMRNIFFPPKNIYFMF